MYFSYTAVNTKAFKHLLTCVVLCKQFILHQCGILPALVTRGRQAEQHQDWSQEVSTPNEVKNQLCMSF